MKYTWDFNEIRNNLKELKEKLLLTDNVDEIDNIKALIQVYKYISTFRKKNNTLNAFDDTLITTDIKELVKDFIPFYNKKDIGIINSILPSIEIINDYNVKLNVFDIKRSNDCLIEEVLHFFKTKTTPKMYYKIKKMIEKGNVLNIVYSTDGCYYPAITICDNILKKKYIHITRENKVTDIPNIAHEFFHYLYEDCNSYKGLYYVNEVDGMFSNILFSDYFMNQTEDDTNKYSDVLKKYYLTGFKSQVQNLVLRHGLIKALDEDYNLDLECLNEFTKEYLKRYFEKEEEIIEYLDTPQETDLIYCFSYLVALDLFYIYKEDKELAFYLIKKIINIKNQETLFKELAKNKIAFFEDNYKNLKKYIKNMTN